MAAQLSPERQPFGKHSTAQQNKVFILVDEIHGDEMRPLMSALKDRITSDTVNINPKGKEQYDVRNFANFLFTTNDMNPLKIEPEERRFVIFACNDSKKGDTAYFARLAAHLARDDVARAFYQYLRDDVDVSPFTPFQAHRPRTEAYFAMQRRNISPFYKFLSFKIIQDDSPGRAVKIMAAEFFAQFQSWHARGYATSQ